MILAIVILFIIFGVGITLIAGSVMHGILGGIVGVVLALLWFVIYSDLWRK